MPRKKKLQPPTLDLEGLPIFEQLVIEGLEENFLFQVPLSGDFRDITFDMQSPVLQDLKKSSSRKKAKAAFDLDPEFPPRTGVDLLRWKSSFPFPDKKSYWISGYHIWDPECPVRHAKGDKRKKQDPPISFLGIVCADEYDARVLWVPRSSLRKSCPLPSPGEDREVSWEFHEVF